MKKPRLILEFTEFNLQRMNPDSFQPSMHVDNPQLSTDAFDKYQSSIQQAMAKITGIMYNIQGNSSYDTLRSRILLEDQDIQSLKILRIVKRNIEYDVYITFVIKEKEYWGRIVNILSKYPEVVSEVFNDIELLQPKEWTIKTKGILVKTIKRWLLVEPGKYQSLKDDIFCYSSITGKQFKISKDTIVEVIRSFDNNITIEFENETFNLVDDNFIYFNWWFLKIDENSKYVY